MIIFYIILILLTFWGCKFSGKEFYKEDFLSKDSTLPVKGIFTWLVFFSHLPNYIKYTSAIDTYGRLVNTLLGQSIVAFILFCSGFGVFESFKKKGLSYARKMPKNRILKTLLHFDIAVLLFLIIQLLSGRPLSFLHIALSFTGWVSIGNSNWYIFVILALYLMTWLSFMFMKENIVKAGIMTTILSVALLILLGCTRLSFWYDTILCYILGIWVSVFKEKFIGLFTKKNSIWTA